MAASEYVMLRGGLAVPLPPYLLLLQLEERGFNVRRDGDVLVVQPCQRLTSDDCQAIRRWKRHLLAMVDYTPPEVS